MRRLLLFLTLTCCVSIAIGQKATNVELAQKTTEKMVVKFDLNDEQTAEMQRIQERKYRNLTEIEGLKKTDIAMYLQKLQSIEYGTDGSILKMLTEAQTAVFNKERMERRKAKAAFQQKMKKEGVSASEIEQKYWEERLAEY